MSAGKNPASRWASAPLLLGPSAVISPGICIYIFSLHYPLSLESFWHHLFTLFVVLKTLSGYVYDQQPCNQNQNHTLLLPSVSWPLQVWHFLCPTEAAAFCTVWCLQNFSKWKTQSPRWKLFGVIRSTVNLLILGARVCSSAESSSALTCLGHQWHENVPQIVETVFWTNWDDDCVFWVLTLLVWWDVWILKLLTFENYSIISSIMILKTLYSGVSTVVFEHCIIVLCSQTVNPK